jgi:hypothetical protein
MTARVGAQWTTGWQTSLPLLFRAGPRPDIFKGNRYETEFY